MTAVTFSPDGRQLAVAPKGSGDVELWNPQTVERLSTLPGAGGIVSQLAYSPDGTLVAAAFKKERKTCDVRVWRTATGELLSTLGEHALGAQAVTFSPDGARLLTTAGDATVMVWDPRTGRRLMANPAGNWRGPFEQTAAVFGLDGSRVAYKKPYLLDSATGSVATELRPQGQVSCLAASPDGRVLATAMAIGTVYLSEFATGNRRADLIGHTGSVRSMAFSADGARLATGSLDGDIRLWDAGNGDSVRLFRGHEGNVEAVVFSPDGRRIISSATDGTIRIWDAGLGDELCALSGDKDFPTAIALSPDGTQLVTAGADGMVQIQGLSNAAVVKARQAAAAAAPDAAAPQASRETRPDRPDPAG
jgi:WD40 repeat protein